MKISLFIPPMSHVNTPYPSTAYLSGFLKSLNHDVYQDDLSLQVFLKLFSKSGMSQLCKVMDQHNSTKDPLLNWFKSIQHELPYIIDPLIRFLQGKDPSFGLKIQSQKTFLSPRFFQFKVPGNTQDDFLDWNFGVVGISDKAKFIASLFIDDLGDVIKNFVDKNFELAKYGEKLASSASSFKPILQELNSPHSLIHKYLLEILETHIQKYSPQLIGLSIPFPGNVLGALQIGKYIKKNHPKIKIVWGGGYVNTELRSLKDSKVFDFVDAICVDAGETPFSQILKYFENKASKDELIRTYICEDSKLEYIEGNAKNILFKNIPAPDYSGLPLQDYPSFVELPNPMHRMWSEFRWNKMILAHGCYWKKCAFCDVNLDYINRYEPLNAKKIVDQMETIISQTGTTGFHFVDEAAPPALLQQMALEINKRKLQVTWWGNVRFDTFFTEDVCKTLKESGCVAVTGGLEVASDRLLKLMNKGVSVSQVAKVTKNFSHQKILVHAYLMYGFPSQTEQETLDALEFVRQLFLNGCLDSAFWHRFAATVHSPIGKNPEKFGIKLIENQNVTFAENEIHFIDPVKTDHDYLGTCLKKALYNFMNGIGLEEDVGFWFPKKKLKTTISKNYIKKALQK